MSDNASGFATGGLKITRSSSGFHNLEVFKSGLGTSSVVEL